MPVFPAMSASVEELHILPSCTGEIEILLEDADFLLVNKPSGLLSVPGRHPANRDSVITRLQQDFPGVAIVHRLDFDTSGIMVIPRNRRALTHISCQFQQRQVEKTYMAIVQGLVLQDQGTIALPIAADTENRPKYKICPEAGKPSLTEYRVLLRDPEQNATRLSLHPVTGRSHQLRLHLQAIGHPILGCGFYPLDSSAERAERLLLHATRLSFIHPSSGAVISLESPPPFI